MDLKYRDQKQFYFQAQLIRIKNRSVLYIKKSVSNVIINNPIILPKEFTK